jgi:hypothetical protein
MKTKIDLDRPEPLLLNTEPVGSNQLTSRATFYQRKLYELATFNSGEISDTKPIDFWYEKMFYGRVGTDSRAVHVSEQYLRQVPGTPDIFALNFVVQAYEDLRAFYRFAASRDAIETSEGPYTNLAPIAGWVNLNSSYHSVMNIMFQKFKAYVLAAKKDSKIRNFESFVAVFVGFVDTATPSLPFTRSKLITSRWVDPKISGLIIDLAAASHGSDSPKVELFLEDQNFPFFKDAAQQFGFVVDRHAPWRIVADLGNPAMQRYMAQYGLTTDKLFKKYYHRSHQEDLAAFQAYLIQFYNSYVSASRVISEPVLEFCKGRVEIKNKEILRETKSQKDLSTSFSAEYWLRLYAYIRGREENKIWNQPQFEKVVRNAVYLKEGVDIKTSIEYISRITSTESRSPRKERGFHFLSSRELA